MAKEAKPQEDEPKLPLRVCAMCKATTFNVKRLVQVRGGLFVNEQVEVRCDVCGTLLVLGA